jgi:hypothetical protein
MRRLLGALALSVAMAGSAEACYCGAARVAACCQPGAQQCCTVMKTCREVVNRPTQYMCYRTCYQSVTEYETVTVMRLTPETHYRECVETEYHQAFEITEREVSYTVNKPVKEMQTVKVCTGHWETKNIECCMPDTKDPCAPAVKTTKTCRVWKPEIVEQQIECIKFVQETVTKKVPYTSSKTVAEDVVKRVPYQVFSCVPVQSTIPIMRQVAKQVPYMVTRYEPVVVERQVAVQVCLPVPCCGK